jgi:hypothetical protein
MASHNLGTKKFGSVMKRVCWWLSNILASRVVPERPGPMMMMGAA